MAEAESLVQAWRSVSSSLTAGVLGMTLLVLGAYVPHALRSGGRVPWHVVLIACSYSVYAFAALTGQIGWLLAGAPDSYRLILHPIAAGLGIVALALILRAREP